MPGQDYIMKRLYLVFRCLYFHLALAYWSPVWVRLHTIKIEIGHIWLLWTIVDNRGQRFSHGLWSLVLPTWSARTSGACWWRCTRHTLHIFVCLRMCMSTTDRQQCCRKFILRVIKFCVRWRNGQPNAGLEIHEALKCKQLESKAETEWENGRNKFSLQQPFQWWVCTHTRTL